MGLLPTPKSPFMSPAQNRVASLIQTAFNRLKLTSSTPRLDAELLMAQLLECRREELVLRDSEPLDADMVRQFEYKVRLRLTGTPIAYMLEEKEFWGLPLKIRPGTLIPRPDTEVLLEEVIPRVQNWQVGHPNETCTVLEVGTGSGAIPLALCAECSHLNVLSIDLSTEALEVARENMQRHANLLKPKGNRLHLLRGDRMEMFIGLARFHFIISNPPYIPTHSIPSLPPDVVNHEPHEALDGGLDGLDFHRYLFEMSIRHLEGGGFLIMEFGEGQEGALSGLVPNGLEVKSVRKDIQGIPRVLSAIRHRFV